MAAREQLDAAMGMFRDELVIKGVVPAPWVLRVVRPMMFIGLLLLGWPRGARRVPPAGAARPGADVGGGAE